MEVTKESGDIYINDLVSVIWDNRFLVSIATFAFIFMSIIYALSLPNMYTSHVLLKPSDNNELLSSKIGAYSTIAGIAGINLPGETVSKSQEAIERIKSIDFFSEEFLPYVKLENLMAVRTWNQKENKISYNKKIFDENSNEWVREVAYPKNKVPSSQEAFQEYLKILSVTQDIKTSFVKISIKHQSPYVSKKWVDLIESNINKSMRDRDMEISKNSIDFLNKEIQKTNLQELKDSIATLLESQIKTLMIASVDEKYVFKTISSSVVSEEKSDPNRFLIVLLGLFIGFFVASISVISYYFFQQKI